MSAAMTPCVQRVARAHSDEVHRAFKVAVSICDHRVGGAYKPLILRRASIGFALAMASRSMMRVLMLDDGEVATSGLVERLRAFGAHVVVLRDFFEVPSLLDSQHFEVLVGHELLLVLALDLKLSSRRCLLTSTPDDWSPLQLAALQVHAVIGQDTAGDELLEALMGSAR